jgi:hypothetical protein
MSRPPSQLTPKWYSPAEVAVLDGPELTAALEGTRSSTRQRRDTEWTSCF